MNLTSARLMGGELRYGNYGFYCSNGRKHVFHHLFSETSGTSMDIGPCEGDSCPFAQTHGLAQLPSLGKLPRFPPDHAGQRTRPQGVLPSARRLAGEGEESPPHLAASRSCAQAALSLAGITS